MTLPLHAQSGGEWEQFVGSRYREAKESIKGIIALLASQFSELGVSMMFTPSIGRTYSWRVILWPQPLCATHLVSSSRVWPVFERGRIFCWRCTNQATPKIIERLKHPPCSVPWRLSLRSRLGKRYILKTIRLSTKAGARMLMFWAGTAIKPKIYACSCNATFHLKRYISKVSMRVRYTDDVIPKMRFCVQIRMDELGVD